MLPPSFTPQLLTQLELFKMQSRRAFLGSRQGGHVSPRRGHGIEFSDYRKYELGDTPRYIDWAVYARTDRLYIKRFQEEEDLNVLLLLDPSASMTTPQSDEKWSTARDIAIALAYISLMSQDTVHVAVPGFFLSPAYSGARAIHSLSHDLVSLKVGGPGSLHREIGRALSRVRFPGVAVLISDLLMPFEEIQALVNSLRAKNLDISVLQLLGASDLDPISGRESASVIDAETGEEIEISLSEKERSRYRDALESHQSMIRDFLLSAGVSLTTSRVSQGLEEIVINDLPRTGLLV